MSDGEEAPDFDATPPHHDPRGVAPAATWTLFIQLVARSVSDAMS